MYPNSQERERNHHGYEVIESIPTPKHPTQIELVPIEDPSSRRSRQNPSHGDNPELRKAPASILKRVLNQLRGWRLGAFLSAVTALFSLVVNAGVVIWLLGKGTGEVLIPLYRGSCSQVAKVDILVHLAINILSTILLGGSNYCMQVLVAPTRAEVDGAHARGKYMDIAVPSIRNLRLISRYKVCLWLTLAFTSLPLHLMYNSAFFKSLSTNAYDVLLTRESFINDQPTDNHYYLQVPSGPAYTYSEPLPASSSGLVNASAIQNNLTSYDKLDVEDCIRTYANAFLSTRRNLVLVIDGEPVEVDDVNIVANFSSRGNDPLLYQTSEHYSSGDPFSWLCDSVPNLDTKVDVPRYSGGGRKQCWLYWQQWLEKPAEWTPNGQKISSCYSEPVKEQCAYSANLPIVIIVMVCNLFKALAMLFVACWLGGRPLTTVGDAIASFLERPDPTTKGFCLLSRHRVQDLIWPSIPGEQVEPMPPIRSQRWFRATSTRRRYCLVFLLLVALVAAVVLLSNALRSINGLATVSSIGLGSLQIANIVDSAFLGKGSATAQIMAAVFAANAPQAIMSFLYINLNAYLTVMWLASEFTDFATERKPLRVSRPKGLQRGTHFLQLPYKISLPLMIFSALLHWLLSQSIFLAVVQEFDSNGDLYDPVAVASCGFSPLAMILVLVAVLLLLGTTIGVSWFRWLKGGIPVAGSCSAAISAACHQHAGMPMRA
ncbi:uncharacterized protein AB675_1873 [Cyphellophora attinorum]|uniref:DUF6536 domain-containing protein n=1 Tax=Cyphellophora attinorum TaxID=1664694 RepID=A0A0N1P1Z7_9EURO|nr:uncharacterized protein AB675_1873 [Phialophora attinorum]KPI43030.1 hypothetical protein AB675_1873 [Phialophora attinorum]